MMTGSDRAVYREICTDPTLGGPLAEAICGEYGHSAVDRTLDDVMYVLAQARLSEKQRLALLLKLGLICHEEACVLLDRTWGELENGKPAASWPAPDADGAGNPGEGRRPQLRLVK